MLYIGDSNNSAKTISTIYVGDDSSNSRIISTIYYGDQNNQAKIIYATNSNIQDSYLQQFIIRYNPSSFEIIREEEM